jgi:cell division septation protein DedD
MLRTSDSETEILLGNKQLIGIFFVLAVLVGVAFYGGYMVGRGTAEKKSVPAVSAPAPKGETAAAASQDAAGGETHSFPADTAVAGEQTSSPRTGAVHAVPSNSVDRSRSIEEQPLGSPSRKPVESAHAPYSRASASDLAPDVFAPQSGEQFLQVAAVSKDEAEAVADVLHKKGFRAHAVPKPGNQKLYRVLIGPISDAGDLSSTREALRRTGFREVIVQRY